MSRTLLFRRRYTSAGAPPGAFHVAAETELVTPRYHVMTFDGETLEEDHPDALGDVRGRLDDPRLVWIDMQGLGDGSVVQSIGEALGLHRLAIADVMNVGQRPKVEDYGEILFCVVRMATLAEPHGIRWEQVSLFIGPGWVITFQERHGDCLGPVRHRIRQGLPRIRTAGSGYLGCMIVDAVVDGYFPILEEYSERLDDLENDIVERPGGEMLPRIFRLKRQLLALRRCTWPLRDALRTLMRDGHARIGEHERPYLRDTTDHVMQIVDINETYREMAASFVDVHLSSIGNRTNEIMRVLTVLASIFIPLTFLAGIYGMNFDTSHPLNLPELGWRYGYVAFWIISLIVAIGLVGAFARMGWIGSRPRRPSREEAAS